MGIRCHIKKNIKKCAMVHTSLNGILKSLNYFFFHEAFKKKKGTHLPQGVGVLKLLSILIG
jgi:hypothetical protein